VLGHLRSQRTTKLRIFTCWSLFAPTVGTVRGEDVVHSTLFGHRMTHFSAISAMAGSSDTTRFGSLEFSALPPIGMWVPPTFEPSQASSEAWTSSPTGSAYYTSARRHLFWRSSKGRPPSALGHTTTSMSRHLCFISSKLSAQTLL
jgi:hypothetical protein